MFEFFFKFYGDRVFFFTGQKPCIFVIRKMLLKLKENPSVLDSIPSHEDAPKFTIWNKVFKHVSINPRFMVVTAGNTAIHSPLESNVIRSWSFVILIYLATVTSLFLSVHLNSTSAVTCNCKLKQNI
jgi:hypothetical protein